MPLSFFIDALPYNEIRKNYGDWFDDMQLSEMLPNIAYSSSLHWQLYCNKYPDDRGVLVDWTMGKEPKKIVNIVSALMRPFDCIGDLGCLSKKVLDRVIFRKHTFANIPYKFRSQFSEQAKYLFWDKDIYSKEPIFEGYTVISQDEGHKSFEHTIDELENSINNGDKNIFAVFGFADAMGHKCRRGALYSERLRPYMDVLKSTILKYKIKYPEEEILIVSDHGMSTVENRIDLELEKNIAKQGKKTYIAYKDSAVMCIWTYDKKLDSSIVKHLQAHAEGHLLTEEEREYFGAADRKFGDFIYILREGNVFSNNWFGKSIKKPSPDGSGMHGFWPERSAKDSLACIALINGKRKIEPTSDYRYANKIICDVMKGDL